MKITAYIIVLLFIAGCNSRESEVDPCQSIEDLGKPECVISSPPGKKSYDSTTSLQMLARDYIVRVDATWVSSNSNNANISWNEMKVCISPDNPNPSYRECKSMDVEPDGSNEYSAMIEITVPPHNMVGVESMHRVLVEVGVEYSDVGTSVDIIDTNIEVIKYHR